MTQATNLVDLTKKVAVVLEKRKIPAIKARVGFAVDISGSMQGLYGNGTMQNVVNRIQAIANRFDNNSELDMWLFNRKGYQIETATPDMFGSYVKQHILTHHDLWGGTSFAPVMRLVESFYFSAVQKAAGIAKGFLNMFASKKEEAPKQTEEPVYLIFLTDGDNDDEEETELMISKLRERNIYIQFVGVGTDSSFRFVRRMADRYSHVGFVDFSQPSKVTDEQMYEQLLNDEFAVWAKKQ